MLQPALSTDQLRHLETHDDRFPYVTGIVTVELDDLLHGDFETFLDDVSTKLVGSLLLMDIGYRVVGTTGDTLIQIEVTGDASAVLDDIDETSSD